MRERASSLNSHDQRRCSLNVEYTDNALCSKIAFDKQLEAFTFKNDQFQNNSLLGLVRNVPRTLFFDANARGNGGPKIYNFDLPRGRRFFERDFRAVLLGQYPRMFDEDPSSKTHSGVCRLRTWDDSGPFFSSTNIFKQWEEGEENVEGFDVKSLFLAETKDDLFEVDDDLVAKSLEDSLLLPKLRVRTDDETKSSSQKPLILVINDASNMDTIPNDDDRSWFLNCLSNTVNVRAGQKFGVPEMPVFWHDTIMVPAQAGAEQQEVPMLYVNSGTTHHDALEEIGNHLAAENLRVVINSVFNLV